MEKRLANLEEQFKESQEIGIRMGDIICKLIREIAENYGLLDRDFEEKIIEIESRIAKRMHPPQ